MPSCAGDNTLKGNRIRARHLSRSNADRNSGICRLVSLSVMTDPIDTVHNIVRFTTMVKVDGLQLKANLIIEKLQIQNKFSEGMFSLSL